MRIGVVTRALPVHGGGGMERLTEDLMRAWTASGHDVICYTTPLPASAAAGAAERVRVVPGRSGRYSAQWRRRLRDAVEPADHDVIIGVSSGAASLLGRTGSTPVVMQAHGTALAELRTKLRNPTARSIAGAVKNSGNLVADLRTYRRYDGVVAVGSGVAADLSTLPRVARPDDPQVIVNGVPGFEGLPERSVPSRGPRHIVFVGRLKREKGVDLLLHAARDRDWHLSIAGDGPEEQALRRLAADLRMERRVQFVGSLTRSDVGALMDSADVVVVPSRRREGLPLVVLEALTLGKRLVVAEPAARSVPRGHGLVEVTAAAGPALQVAVDRVLDAPEPEPDPAFLIHECAASYIRYFERLRATARLS